MIILRHTGCLFILSAGNSLQRLPQTCGQPTKNVLCIVKFNEERFTFTAKAPREGNRTPMNNIKYSEERGQETGYGYFGARYYDHKISALWLSVDPISDKYPGISPYAYCA